MIKLFDTTLRDGSQAEGISFSPHDKLRVALELDRLGVQYIEGGWPGSNPKDNQFFQEARKLKFKHAKLVAFGSTRRKGISASHDSNLKAIVASKSPCRLHLRKILGHAGHARAAHDAGGKPGHDPGLHSFSEIEKDGSDL